jgi:hypothetical protein
VRLTQTCAPVLLATLLLGTPCLAGPTLKTFSPEDNQRNQLGAFSIVWATAGVAATAAVERPEADAATLFFSGKDFTGIDTLHRRGFTTLGTLDEVMAGGSGTADDSGSLHSSSVFVGNSDRDRTDDAAAAIAPSPDIAIASVVASPPAEIVSKPAETSRSGPTGGGPGIPSAGTRQADRPATVPRKPTLELPRSVPGAPVNVGQPAVKVSNSSVSTARPAGQTIIPGASASVHNSAGITDLIASHATAEAAKQWLLANLVARNHGFVPGQLREAQPPIESFRLTRAPASDGAPPSNPGSDATVVLPIAPLPSLDTALGANVRIYRNSPSGTATVGRLEMALQTLRTLSGPQIVSIAISIAGLSGLIIVWRRWRRREALEYKMES